MDHDELRDLLDSWELHLRGSRKSRETIKNYTIGVRLFLSWCAENDRPPNLDKNTVLAFIVALQDAELEASTARARHLALRRFSAWLAEENEIERDELLGLKPPQLDKKVVEVLSPDQLKALIAACKGKEMWHRRDEAIVRFMAETAARAGEVASMRVSDVDLKAGMATVRRGKGGKGRRFPFGPQTGQAIDRYLRARRKHRLAGTDALWLGDRGKTFSYYGLYDTLKRRAEMAGIDDFHPHMLRHTAADRWLDRGGSERGLMAVAGWSRSDMLVRYTQRRAEDRAADEARRLNLGDL